ncbi:hypothetical protein AAFF_G00195910 [Aldrovandia affinis]|uniref:Uncharacterized protein n=1 Tax=Aldrovandia affinis TaxID=143900 RepID=A0AAD7W5I6_9TELE|nr:hypothetical protein AAFF_G00195910 [Aldrovandia affinis]
MDVPGPSHQYAASTGLHTGKEEVEEVHPERRVPCVSFDSVGSDHRVVAARLRLSLRVPRAPRARPDWEAFREALNSRPTTQRRGCAARTRVEEARRSFVREGTAESQEELNGAKQQLFSTYDRIKGEELMEKVKKVETVHGERRYKESWKVITR